MQTSLFRQEAIDHQREPIRGSVLLAASPRSTWLGLGAFVAAALLLGYAWVGEFSRKANVRGFLAPTAGVVQVYPQVRGTLRERRVDEGDPVRAGDVLGVLATGHGSLSVGDANRETLALLRERESSLEQERESRDALDALTARRLERNVANLEREREQLIAARDTVAERLAATEREAARFASLAADGFVPATQVEQERDRVLEQRGRLQAMERDLTALQGRLDDLASQRIAARIEGDTARAELERRIGEVRQEITAIAANNDVVIRAPADGVVSAVLVSPGQQVQPDAPLLSIVPHDARLEARLLVPSHAIGFVTTGQPVALRYTAFPYQRFGHYRGEVASIARSLLLPGEARLPLSLQEPAYLVTVSLAGQAVSAYGKAFPLQAGMALDADIVLDRRSIIAWIFDPLFSLVKRT